MGKSLCGRVVDEVYSLRNVSFKTFFTSFKKLFLISVDVWKWILCSFCAGRLEIQSAKANTQVVSFLDILRARLEQRSSPRLSPLQ